MKSWKVFLMLTGILLLGAGNAFTAPDGRTDLTGRVTETNGAPLAKAEVFIYTAGPRKGTSSFCPSCYADCRKRAQTDAEGRFKIESVDPALIFRLLVVAGGHKTRIVSKVDPAKGEQNIALKALTEAELKSNLRCQGRVAGEDGKPVAWAMISTEGIDEEKGGQWGGTDDYVEPMAVAGEDGRFVLYCKNKNVTLVHAVADGRGVARQWVELKPGGEQVIQMQEGVTVTGKVLRDGKPLAGAGVGLVTSDRQCGRTFTDYENTTDTEGRFRILNVPPNREFVLYGQMDSLGGEVALPNRIFTTGHSRATVDMGELAVNPAYKVSGRIVLSDHKVIPAGTRVLLCREEAWDTSEVMLAPDGTFEFKGVPAEAVSFSVSIDGYKFSKRNPSLDWGNGDILGRVTGDMSKLDFLMEPGEWQFNETHEGMSPADIYPQDKPLRGAKI